MLPLLEDFLDYAAVPHALASLVGTGQDLLLLRHTMTYTNSARLAGLGAELITHHAPTGCLRAPAFAAGWSSWNQFGGKQGP